MKIYFKVLFIFLFVMHGCKKEQKKEYSSQIKQIEVNENSDCVDFVALWSAGEISEKIGKDKKWVFLNYTVTLWDIPPSQGHGNAVGKLRASSYARIIEIDGDDYKVESPINQVHGWINGEHVKTISRKNPKICRYLICVWTTR